MDLGRYAHPAIADRARRRREVPRDAADLASRNAGDPGRALGGEGQDPRGDRVEPIQVLDRPRQPFIEEGRQQAQQKRRVRARPDEMMLARDHRGLGPSRVDHDQLATARLDRPQPLGHIRHGHQAAVRHQRVGAQHQEIVGVVDVGDRQQQLMAVHPIARELERQLIDRGRREPVLGPDQPEIGRGMGHHAPIMHVGIALVCRDRVAAMGPDHRRDAFRGKGERLVPADRAPVRPVAPHRRAQPVRVGLDILQRHCLRADMAAAERIGRIALDRDDAIILDLDRQAADRFAQIAGTIMRDHSGAPSGSFICWSRVCWNGARPAT